jgi:hypothetical protein
MIFTAILTILYGVVYAVISPLLLFSDASLPSGITSSISTASEHLAAVDVFVPVGTIIAILTSFIVIETGIFVFKMVMWIIKKIPTIN